MIWLIAALLALAPRPIGAEGHSRADAAGVPEQPSDAGSRAEPAAGEAMEGGPGQAGSTEPADEAPTGPMAAEAVLPCGLRVIAARDNSLPVAAVILAIETGTEDDPPDLPGLVHALTYHLLQGNRDLSPGAAQRAVHDTGGWSGLAIGAAQVRFENVAPASELAEVLWVETNRLRAPTVSAALWKKTLRSAGRDHRLKLPLPPLAMAAVHGDVEGLAHDGREVGKALSALQEDHLAKKLADGFRYESATLVVVAPEDPRALVARVARKTADLPRAEATTVDRFVSPGPSEGPREVPFGRHRGNVLAWAVPPGPAEAAWAGVLCGVLNRQRRSAAEPRRSRVRCRLHEDTRRATLVVTASNIGDPMELVRGRLQRVLEGDEEPLLEARRRVALRDLRRELRTPLALARRLALRPLDEDRPEIGDVRERPLDDLTGVAKLRDSRSLMTTIPSLLSVDAAIRLMPAPKPTPPSDSPPEEKTP